MMKVCERSRRADAPHDCRATGRGHGREHRDAEDRHDDRRRDKRAPCSRSRHPDFVAAKQRWRWHVRIIHQADLNYLNYWRIYAAVCLLDDLRWADSVRTLVDPARPVGAENLR